MAGFFGSEYANVIAHSILVVESDPEQAVALRDLLQEHGYQVKLAKDGGQAHSAITMNRPDLVLLALILPGESGFEICDRIKQRDDRLPVIIVSAITLDDAKDLATRVGADAYVTKPYDPDHLLSTIQDVAQQVWERTHLGKPTEERRVRFNCRCGKRFKMNPSHGGRHMTCPDCGEPLIVPHHV